MIVSLCILDTGNGLPWYSLVPSLKEMGLVYQSASIQEDPHILSKDHFGKRRLCIPLHEIERRKANFNIESYTGVPYAVIEFESILGFLGSKKPAWDCCTVSATDRSSRGLQKLSIAPRDSQVLLELANTSL